MSVAGANRGENVMAVVRRRAVVSGAAMGALIYSIAGVDTLLTPREARAQGVALKVLKPDEAHALEAFAEALAPGARDDGIALFVDQQCSVPPHEALLALRIANARPPFVNFYRAALTEIDRQSAAKFGKAFAALSASEQHDFIDLMRQSTISDWKGPPQAQIYNICREDAVDVVYGTVDGFKRLGVPYMPHVLPTERW